MARQHFGTKVHELYKLYSFFVVDQQTNQCYIFSFSSSSSQTILEELSGCILACSLWLTGPNEVSFGLHCFIAELNTHTVFECNAPECH